MADVRSLLEVRRERNRNDVEPHNSTNVNTSRKEPTDNIIVSPVEKQEKEDTFLGLS